MNTENKSVAELAAETKSLVERKFDEVKAHAERAEGMAKHNEELTKGLKEQIDEALVTANETKGILTELEQRLATASVEQKSALTPGDKFVEDEAFKSFAEQTRPRGRIVVEVKDISSLTTDAPGSAGGMIQSDRRGMQVELPQRRLTVRALLASGQTNSNAIEYERERLFSNNAAPVAEGALKPQSEIQVEDATATVRTIAHWMRASTQVLADAPALRAMIDQRLRYGLASAEEAQLLNGSGIGQNLLGLIPAATVYAAPGGITATTPLDILRTAVLQASLAEYQPNGVIMNPIDLAVMEMAKDGQGQYLIGNPQGNLTPTLWGLPVVTTQAIGVDKALVGAFNMAAQIFDRQDATVEVSTEDQDNFVRNKVTIRAEERLALAIYRPQALVYADLGRVV